MINSSNTLKSNEVEDLKTNFFDDTSRSQNLQRRMLWLQFCADRHNQTWPKYERNFNHVTHGQLLREEFEEVSFAIEERMERFFMKMYPSHQLLIRQERFSVK